MSKLFFRKYMIKRRVFPLARQKIFSIFVIFIMLITSILTNYILQYITSLYLNEIFIISQCVFIGGSIIPFMLLLQEKYVLLDNYPYMLTKDFHKDENVSIGLRIELQEYCGVNTSQYNGKWIIWEQLEY